MGLFTDGPIASLDALRSYEGSVLDTASTEGVDLAAKLSLAKNEIGLELVAFLTRQGIALGTPHKLDRVIVTEPLVHWHCLHTLELIYRDAYSSQLNDRYQGKWREYAQLSRRAMDLLLGIGVGLTNSPTPKSLQPTVITVAGGALPAAVLYVSTAWMNAAGSTGEWSDPVAISVAAGNLLQVQAGTAPGSAIGWCVYAGASEDTMRRQNELPLGMSGTWQQPSTGLRSDLAAFPKQSPDQYIKHRRELLRG